MKIDLEHFESFLTKTVKYTSFLIYIKNLNKIINCFSIQKMRKKFHYLKIK